MKLTPDIEDAMRRAGLHPEQFKAKRGKKREVWPEPCLWKFAPGILLVNFEVPARPIPWKSPTVTRSGVSFKDASLKRWQKEVRECGKGAMRGKGPYSCEVKLVVDFHLTPRPGSAPDTSNLTKALEDSLQGPVIVNDRAVIEVVARRLRSERDYAEVWIYSAKQGD